MIIKNGMVLHDGKLVKKHIVIEGRIIKKLTGSASGKKEVIDAKGKIIVPGLIDCHVHMREPGFEQKEDFFSGSKAAAAGGITTFLDMPNTNPPTTSMAALRQKKELAKKSVVNYGFHFGTLGDNIEEIKEAWKSNIASVKIYMDETTGKMVLNNEEKIREVMKNSRIVAMHAEGKNAETAVRAVKSVKSHGTRLYLCHVSAKSEIEFLEKHRAPNIFAEATPHHLFLTEKNVSQYNIMKPVLKTEEDRKSLWDGIKKGVINTIATDHAPHTHAEKELETAYGVPGLETMLPLLLDAVNKKQISLEKAVKLTSENPARIFRIKNRGRIEKGFIADMAIVDMELEKEVENEKLFTKCSWSQFAGWKLKGWPVMTIVNGQLIFDNGEIKHVMGEEVEFG